MIRDSSVSIIFVELSFKPVYPTMVMKTFKFMKNFNFWDMYFKVKVLSLDISLICYHLPPLFSLSPLESQATMIWNIMLGYMICNFFKCDYVTIL